MLEEAVTAKRLSWQNKTKKQEHKEEKTFNEMHNIETFDGDSTFNDVRNNRGSSNLSESTKNTSDNCSSFSILPPLEG